MMMRFFMVVGAVLISGIPARAVEADAANPLQVTLSAQKSRVRLGEAITFTVSFFNASAENIPVMVQGYDWADLVKFDADFVKRTGQDAGKHPNPADEIRAQGGVFPLGKLELVPGDGRKETLRFEAGGTLFCGTSLKKGLMPPGTRSSVTFSLPKGTFGPPGVYQFVWKAARPEKGRSNWKLSEWKSNPVSVEVLP